MVTHGDIDASNPTSSICQPVDGIYRVEIALGVDLQCCDQSVPRLVRIDLHRAIGRHGVARAAGENRAGNGKYPLASSTAVVTVAAISTGIMAAGGVMTAGAHLTNIASSVPTTASTATGGEQK